VFTSLGILNDPGTLELRADPAYIEAQVVRLAELGADLLKVRLMNQPFQALVLEAAQRHGLPVTAHLADAPSLARGIAGKEHAWGDAPDAEAPLYAESGLCVTPTLMTTIYNRMGGRSRHLPIEVPEDSIPVDLYSPAYLEWSRSLPERVDDEAVPELDAALLARLEKVRDLYEHGVRLATGTDAPDFWGVRLEIEAFVYAGMSPLDALRAATYDAASCIGVEDRLGSLEEGKIADFILVAGNPAERIQDLRRIRYIVLGGRAYAREDLGDLLRSGAAF
jgi:hypothetical protein